LAKRRLVRFLPVQKAWEDPRYFYGAPTYEQAKRIAWDHLLRLIPENWIAGSPSHSELVIRTVFGSELWVVGLDKPARVEGVQWDGCVIDESCDIKPGTFDRNVLPALSWRDAWCWRIGVPKRHGIGVAEYREFFQRAAAGELENAAGFTWPSEGIVPQAALDHAKQHMDIKDFREQFEAKFETAGGQIFFAYTEEYNVRPVTYRPDKAIVVGSDFNVDPMAWVIGHRWLDRFEVFDELWMRNTNTMAALDVLYQRYQDHQAGFEFYGDATGRARKTSAVETDYLIIANDERFKRLGRSIHYPEKNPAVQDRFAACNAMFRNAAGDCRLFIDPRCKHLKDDLQMRGYKPGSRDPDDSGDVGHITDALGYIISLLYPIRVRIATSRLEVTTT